MLIRSRGVGFRLLRFTPFYMRVISGDGRWCRSQCEALVPSVASAKPSVCRLCVLNVKIERGERFGEDSLGS